MSRRGLAAQPGGVFQPYRARTVDSTSAGGSCRFLPGSCERLLRPRNDLVDLAVIVGDIQLAARVLAEAHDAVDGVPAAGRQRGGAVLLVGGDAADERERLEEWRAVVAEEVLSAQIVERAAAIDEATADGAANGMR